MVGVVDGQRVVGGEGKPKLIKQKGSCDHFTV